MIVPEVPRSPGVWWCQRQPAVAVQQVKGLAKPWWNSKEPETDDELSRLLLGVPERNTMQKDVWQRFEMAAKGHRGMEKWAAKSSGLPNVIESEARL